MSRACADLPPAAVGECIALLDDGDCKGDVYPTRDHDGVKCARCGILLPEQVADWPEATGQRDEQKETM